MNSIYKNITYSVPVIVVITLVSLICRTNYGSVYPLPPTGPCGGDTTSAYPHCAVKQAQNGAISFPGLSQIVSIGYDLQDYGAAPTIPPGAIGEFYYGGLGLAYLGLNGDNETLAPPGSNAFAYTMLGQTVGSASLTFSIPVPAFDPSRVRY